MYHQSSMVPVPDRGPYCDMHFSICSICTFLHCNYPRKNQPEVNSARVAPVFESFCVVRKCDMVSLWEVQLDRPRDFLRPSEADQVDAVEEVSRQSWSAFESFIPR